MQFAVCNATTSISQLIMSLLTMVSALSAHMNQFSFSSHISWFLLIFIVLIFTFLAVGFSPVVPLPSLFAIIIVPLVRICTLARVCDSCTHLFGPFPNLPFRNIKNSLLIFRQNMINLKITPHDFQQMPTIREHASKRNEAQRLYSLHE